MRLIAAAACVWSLLCLSAWPSHAEKRVALVAGNNSYSFVPALKNPAADTRGIAAALTRLRFETTLLIDADARTMNEGLKRFAQSATGAEVIFVFYSGHGAQFEGRTWLLPVDAKLESKEDTNDADLMALDRILSTLRDKSAVRIVVLDACRSNAAMDSLNRKLAEAEGLKDARRSATAASPSPKQSCNRSS